MRRIFRPEGHNLFEARKGLQGLSIAESQDLDLILLDINLPDIDGYEVTRRLRCGTKAVSTHLRIIAVTANALQGDSKKAIDAGCDVYMSKPINIIELLETVDALVCKEPQGNMS